MSNRSEELRHLLPLALVTFAAGTDNFVIAGLLPAISRDLHVGIAQTGQLVTVYSLVVALAAPVLAALTAPWRRDRALLGGLAVFLLGNLATGMSGTFTAAVTARAITALGAALMTPSASALTVALTPPERRGRALALVMGGLMVATAAGVPVGLVVGRLDWRYTMWAVAGLSLLCLIAVALFLPAVHLPALSLSARLRPLRHPRLLLIAGTTILVLTGNFAIFTYASLVTGESGLALVAVLTGFGLSSVAGNSVAGHLTDRIGGARTTLVCIVGLLIALVAMPFVLRLPLPCVVAAYAVNGFFGGILTVPQQARAVAVDPASASVLLALLSSAVFLGFAAAGAWGALLAATVGPQNMPWGGAAVLVIPLALTLFASDRSRSGEVASRA